MLKHLLKKLYKIGKDSNYWKQNRNSVQKRSSPLNREIDDFTVPYNE